jgi:phosphatidylglycerol:prolipoprotein diacylglycerol transferase
MHPKILEIPFIHLTLGSFGPMMVIGFLAAVTLIRRLSRDITPDPQLITNAALYSLITGVVGARLFYVVHHFDQFQGQGAISLFAVWKGGLELLGGVIPAIVVIFLYARYHKLPVRQYFDILAIGLMLALVFGRIGCFLNGCCFGKPANLPWAVRFPYGSFAYRSQVEPDTRRNRPQSYVELPEDFFTYGYSGNTAVRILQSYEKLTSGQKEMLRETDRQRSLAVHPTQLYESAGGAVLCVVLYLLWRRVRNARQERQPQAHRGDGPAAGRILTRPGCIFSLMFVLYGILRFFIELLRDDNPFEFDGLTISQIISIGLILTGAILMAIFQKAKQGGRPNKFRG